MRAAVLLLAAVVAVALPVDSRPLPTSAAQVYGPKFSASGRWIGFLRLSEDCCVGSLIVVRADGKLRRTVARNVRDWEWAPRGDRLAAVSEDPALPERAVRFMLATPRRTISIPLRFPFWQWAPNGREIAVLAGPALHLLRSDGSEVKEIGGGGPTGWSPTGDWISYAAQEKNEIHLVRPDGSGDHLLVEGTGWPLWSSSGRWISFTRTPSRVVFAIHPDGSGLRVLTLRPGTVQWSPKGDKAAVAHVGWLGESSVEVVDLKTGRVVPVGVGWPTWSPKGDRLALNGELGDGASIVDADGSHRVFLYAGASAVWSPEGRRLLVSGPYGIELFRSNGTFLRSLGFGDAPAWAPNGRRFVFVGGTTDCNGVFVKSARGGRARFVAGCRS